ncbi:Adaptin ear-binding coat-associated protein 2 like [Verticillium longisporum]
MEPAIDIATGQPLPADAIQRILFLAPAVHVYNIPPLTSNKGHTAAHWTADNNQRLIFTARLRVLETAWEDDASAGREKIKVDIVLEDPATGQLFAAAPYTAPAVVEPVLDSSRFFALQVRDPSGRKALLGIGFEERSDAFDFGVATQEAQKSLGLDGGPGAGGRSSGNTNSSTQPAPAKEEQKRDLSLKEGETITVNLGGKFGRRRPQQQQQQQQQNDPAPSGGGLSAFSLPPPPSASSAGSRGSGLLPPPPPSASQQREERERKRRSAQDLGFDDGQFGEFA